MFSQTEHGFISRFQAGVKLRMFSLYLFLVYKYYNLLLTSV